MYHAKNVKRDSFKNCRTSASDIKVLSSLIIEIQEEIQNLKSSNVDVRPANVLVCFEKVVIDETDNFGLEEPDQNLIASLRITIDKHKVADILQVIKPKFIS